MRRYSEIDDDVNVEITKYKIIVPTENDKQELLKAFEYIHDRRDIDTGYIVVNQLVHEYLTPERTGDPRVRNSIIVNKDLYNFLESCSEDFR